ncbi:MAG: ACT domain-containing protein [Elusimicrobiaceae bacterium]|nr:ACT domain-containing protein [Elusimicrobiaceae bacterium]
MTKISKVIQYSVFLVNEPGSLERFSKMIADAGLDIVGISSDVRYESAVVKFVIAGEKDINLPSLIAKNGYTAIRTDAICIQAQNRVGFLFQLSKLLGEHKININNIYSAAVEDTQARIFLVVDDLEKAVSLLEEANL